MSTHLLRHAVATVAYRGGKMLRDAPAGFSSFRPKDGSRSAGEILAHVCDLYEWALSLAEGTQKWKNATPQTWERDTARFFEALGKFDQQIQSVVGPHIQQTDEAIHRLAGGRSLLDAAMTSMLSRFTTEAGGPDTQPPRLRIIMVDFTGQRKIAEAPA